MEHARKPRPPRGAGAAEATATPRDAPPQRQEAQAPTEAAGNASFHSNAPSLPSPTDTHEAWNADTGACSWSEADDDF